jgi:hypothetical protein
MDKKSCKNCKHLSKYTNTKGEWMNVCEGEEPEALDDGSFLVYVIDTSIFDAGLCILFVEKEKTE